MVVATGLILAWFNRWAKPYLNVESEGTVQVTPDRIGAVAAMVSPERLKATVETLAGEGSRLTGSAGAEAAASFLEGELKGILGAGAVREETVNVSNPYDLGMAMTIGGAVFRVRPFWFPELTTYRLPAGGKALGPVRRVTFARVIAGRERFDGEAIAFPVPGPEDLRDLAFAAYRAKAFAVKLRDPLITAERRVLDLQGWSAGRSKPDLDVLDVLVAKQHEVLANFLFSRFQQLQVRSVLFLEPKGLVRPYRVEPRSFDDHLLKHASPLPRFLVDADDAAAVVDGAVVSVRQAPAALTVKATGAQVRLYPLWPNLVRTASTPRAGLTGPLVWAGRGTLDEIKGKPIRGSIVLVDFNVGYSWVTLADMGARAVLFAEPGEIMRGESEGKYLSLPADIPRYWVPAAEAARLRALEGSVVRVDAQVVWETRTARTIIGRLPGTQVPKPGAKPDPEATQPVILQASYDDVSIVPDLAPGGEQACSAAALLELARVLKRYPLKKDVLFILTPGHAQTMRGWAEWLHRHFAQADLDGKTSGPDYIHPGFVVHLDLTTRTRRLGVFFKGSYLDTNDQPIKRVYSNFGKSHADAGQKAAAALGYGESFVVDAINAVSGRSWDSYVPGRFTTEQELTLNAGLYGVAYITPDDERAWVDTPHDTPSRMDFESLTRQTRVLAATLPNVLNVGAAFGSSKVKNNWTSLHGRVVEFDPRVHFMPDRTVDGAIVWVHGWIPFKSLKGVRGEQFIVARGAGEEGGAFFDVHGLGNTGWLATGWKAHTIAEAFEVDPMDGSVRYAPDRGPSGVGAFALETDMNEAKKELTLVTFPCRSFLMFDLVDPLKYGPLERMDVLEARTDSPPPLFGQSMAVTQADTYVSYTEPLAVAYVPAGSSVKVVYSMRYLGRRAALINATDAHPEGEGYPVDKTDRLNFTTLHVARDLLTLNTHRLQELKHFGIQNRFLEELNRLAGDRLIKAEAALIERNYREALAQARASWGLSARVSPDVANTATSVVLSAMFFLALLMPFSFFAERLLFGSPEINKQVAGVIGVFLVMFAAIYVLHPAFQIALTPIMILLAFVIMALSGIMAALIGSRFFAVLREEREALQGVHRADVSKVRVAIAAFLLGVSNMRKRPLRTFLTCMTLVVLTFAVLSLASVQQAAKQKKWSIGKKAPYTGMLFRATNWAPLQDPALQNLRTELAGVAEPAPRSWFVSTDPSKQTAVEIVNADRDQARATAIAALGMTAAEREVSRADQAVKYGRWFNPGAARECLLPVRFAATLFIGPGDVGKARVVIFGVPFTVVGLFDPVALGRIRDLDDEEIAPVNFEASENRRRSQNQSAAQEGQLPQRYDHHDPSQIVILPHADLMRLGGRLATIAVPFADPAVLEETMKNLLHRLGLLVYVGRQGTTFAYSAVGDTAAEGLGNLFIPLLIAIAITFSTMLGAVQERRREISVFSAVGLSPTHVFWLFIAESTVYAILGAVIGYLAGQGVGFLIVHAKWFAGLNVNFSAGGAILAVVLVMGAVFLSTLYPARLAARLARPSQVGGFVMPATVGDEVKLELPFSFNARDAQATTAFLAEYFDAHAEASAGEFSAGNIRLGKRSERGRDTFQLTARVWLAPYDFGVSQDLTFSMREGIGDSSSAGLVIVRQSGDQASWRRVNARFLKDIRKQFLIWRSLGEPARLRYQKTAAVLLAKGGEVAHAAA